MQLTAELIKLLPIQIGTGKNGEWKKRDIIVETGGQYSKKICVSIWGDKINESHLQVGNNLQIDFDIESREYNNKWYNDINAWKDEVTTDNSQTDSYVPVLKNSDFEINSNDGFPF